jgi:outer membrane protein assembly factor BamB
MMWNDLAWVGTAAGLLALAAGAPAGDWPQWRYDAGRSADSPEKLPAALHLHWVRACPPRVQAWDDPLNNDLMTYDRVLEPVVADDRMFVGFNDRDALVALDVHTGRELWTFFAEGPVRLPPVAGSGRVYFVSDDGHLYCLRAADGALVWKFRGGPSSRKVLGNGRVISAWPARGGPVLRDGQVYFAASIWPFMGTFIYALDAQTGQVVWVNDATGAQYLKQPHSAPSFAGVAPQGALVATKDFLLVPGGRSVPAAFERATGRFVHFNLDDGGKGNGGSFVAANETEFFVHTRLRGTRAFSLKTGKKGTFTINEPVLAGNRLYSAEEVSSLQKAVLEAEEKLAAARQAETDARFAIARAEDEADREAWKKATNSLASARRRITRAENTLAAARVALGTNWTGHVVQAVGTDRILRWEVPADGSGDIIKAGSRLYVAGTNALLAFELPAAKGPGRLVWSNHVEGRVLRLLAASGKLFAVTLEGRILAFGGRRQTPLLLEDPRPAAAVAAGATRDPTAPRDGYALWFGVDDGAVLAEVLRQSELHVTAVDPDPVKVDQLRRRFDAAGLYGRRVALHVGEPAGFKAPPYIASLVVVGESLASRMVERAVVEAVFSSVRPYGGNLWVLSSPSAAAELANNLSVFLPGATITSGRSGVNVAREGPLPGAADWTHQYGDVANTVKSDDRLVKLPLGLLWFGGNTHQDVLPRHGHGPSEQVVGGRLFIQGHNTLSARDVYTGRVLWTTDFGDLGTYGVYYDFTYTNTPLSTLYNQKHIPGANARGANFVATPEAVYIVVSNACRVLDVANGRTLRTIELPRAGGPLEEPPQWGYLGVYEDVLLAGSGYAHYSQRLGLRATNTVGITNVHTPILDLSASRGLVAFQRHTGEVLWQVEARHSFLHNGIVAGNGRVYCMDRLPKSVEDKLKRRGRATPKDYRVAAFNVRSGELVWESATNVFGTWLGYSAAHDVLLQAGASAADRLKDEAEKGMITYRGASGAVLWSNLAVKYNGPCILHRDTILTTPGSYKTNTGAFGLLDGRPRTVVNPVTGRPEPLRIYRTYGCNYPVACENLLTFRSGAAGFYDLETHGGTGNFGGFKSGCTANLIAANGVLNAPDYTRTCSCSYQNQTSLALVHLPELADELEVWTHNQYGAEAREGVRIQRLGINFGAPGDRLASTGTLWIDHPNVSGSSPHLSVTLKGSRTNYFRRHATQVGGEGPAWVMASGVKDIETLAIIPETRKPPPPPPAPKKKAEEEEEDDDEPAATNATASASQTLTNATAAKAAAKTATNRVGVVPSPPLPPAPYTVRLFFVEPDNLRPGERVFTVHLQGQPVLRDFDIAREAGGPWRGVVKEFRRVVVTDQLALAFTRASEKRPGAVLCGVELLLEESWAGESHTPGGN